MLDFHLEASSGRPNILCLGAHCDDIEIGCGGTILKLAERYPQAHVDWVVFSSNPERAREAHASAHEFLCGFASSNIIVEQFRNSFFPWEGAALKERFEELKVHIRPDLVFTHHRRDFHQDHRTISELTWNTFRDHAVLEYEIMKFDGDLGRPNAYIELSDTHRQRKVELLMSQFPSQSGKQWFTPDTFHALMRLRGVECNAASGHAEAFFAPKLRLLP